MPMTFTDAMVLDHLRLRELSTDGTISECRERLALFTETKYNDFLGAWEIRTGRPWNEMTRAEANDLYAKCPGLRCNPGLLSRIG
jgi:hypothetical protein